VLTFFACMSVACRASGGEKLAGDPNWTAFYDRPATLAAVQKSNQPAPLVVMLESDPWRMVIGSDSPSFAMYDDGTVIFATDTGYKTTKLDGSARDALLRDLQIEGLSSVSGGYRASDWTDQPTTALLVYRKEGPAYISIYGSLKDDEVRSKVPEIILAATDKLHSFGVVGVDQSNWQPDKIEVMVWPYEYAPEPSIIWPVRWPGLKASDTKKRGEDSFSIYIPSAELPELKAFLKTRKAKGAVEIDGKKWSVSYRLPFPQEQLWMAPKSE
jgi:hypothetical protein